MRLWQAGIHPLNGFNRVEFAGGHDTAAVAVYEGRLEVGAGHDGAVLGLAGRRGYKDAGDVLVNIDWSDPIPSDPVAIHTTDAAVRKQVADALLAIAKPKDNSSAGNVAVKGFWDTDEGFDPIAPKAQITPEKYDTLFAVMEKMGLRSRRHAPQDVGRWLWPDAAVDHASGRVAASSQFLVCASTSGASVLRTRA